MTEHGSHMLATEPVTVPVAEAMVGVLDLGVRCEEPGHFTREILPGVAALLERARGVGVPIFYTIVASERGTPYGAVAGVLKRRLEEPVVYGSTFDKFANPEVRALFEGRESMHLVLVGGATTFAIMYTATTAANIYQYQAVIPVDGVAARGAYEQEYALHQMSILPSSVIRKIAFTHLADITFA